MYYGLLIIGLAYLMYRVIVSRVFQRRCEMYLSQIPKVPNSMPFLGVAMDLASGEPWVKFADWSKTKGNTFQFELNGERLIYTSEPKFIKRVVQTKQRNYKKAVDFGFKHFMCLLGKGLVTSEGDVHMRARGQLINVFRTDLLDDIPRLSINAVTRLFQMLSNAELGIGEGSAAKNQDKEKSASKPADLLEGFRLLTLEVIANAIMSISPEESDKVFPKLYMPIAEECNKRSWKPWRCFYPVSAWQHWSRCRELDNFFSNYVKKRKQLREKEQKEAAKNGEKKVEKKNFGGRTEDILDRVMAYHEPRWDPKVSVPQLRDDVKTFILAGHETSGTTLTWASYELMRNPDILKLIREEHEAVFKPKEIGAITEEAHLPSVETLRTKLVWTYAVLREVLRLYSIVPLLPRVTAQDDYILKDEWGGSSDILIPAETMIMVGVDGLHHRPDIWPDPDKFNPKRFLDMSLVSEQLFMPFIYGPRNCLGQHLSLLESAVVLSYTMYHWDFTFANPKDEKEGLTRDPLIAPLAPLGGLQVIPKQRTQNKGTYPTFLK